jgi:hypothetical protein
MDANNRPIQDSQHDETFRGAYTGINLTYGGFARPGSAEGSNVWKIFLIAYDIADNLISVKWPISATTGAVSSDYEFNWTGRAGYVYV